jgi:hypothetical protein
LPRLTACGFFFRRFFLGRCFDRGDIRDIVQSRAPVVYSQKRANVRTRACERSNSRNPLTRRESALYLGAERESRPLPWSDRAGGRAC